MRNLRTVYYSIIVILVLVFAVTITKDEMSGSQMGIIVAISLALLALGATLLSSIKYIINNPRSTKSMIVGVVLLLALAAIGYATSAGYLGADFDKYGVETAHQSKMVDMGIFVTLALSAIAVVSILVSGVVSLVKN